MPPEDDHHHCKVCGRVCAPDADVCSKACRQKRDENLANRRRYTFLLYAAILFSLLVLALSYLRL